MLDNRQPAVVILLALLALLPAGCSKQSRPELVVSAAISLRPPLDELATLFQREHRIKVRFNYGASGLLAQQIRLGAPADLFVSASTLHITQLTGKRNLGHRASVVGNRLVLVVPKSETRVTRFSDLKKTAITRIAIGNPGSVPAGQYAQELLRHLKLWSAIKPKLIFAEHAGQLLDYVRRNEVDAALVYSSDAGRPGGKLKIVASAPSGSHKPIQYSAVVVRGRNDKRALAFLTFLRSQRAIRIFRKHGFTGPGGER